MDCRSAKASGADHVASGGVLPSAAICSRLRRIATIASACDASVRGSSRRSGGSMPRSCALSERTASMVIRKVSPFGLVMVHWVPLSSTRFGAFIQFSGL